jgi:putative spermidine/putrescine transport system ATP-binding protein
MVLTVDNLGKSFRGKRALNNVSFSMEKGELLSIIGPSGAGKTTLLKIIAGLEEPGEGSIRIRGPKDSGKYRKKHPAVLVFQDYLLFPYLTVYENIAFGLRAGRIRKEEIGIRVDEMLSFFSLADRSKAYPRTLSAGEQQRVALARALVVRPLILLLDEPFANLDKNLKLRAAEFIRETQQTFGITTILVTHDQPEAFAVADRIGILLGGELRQTGTFREVYDSPASLDIARFLGPVNIIPYDIAAVLQRDSGAGVTRNPAPGESAAVRADWLEIEPDSNGPGTVRAVYPTGAVSRIILDVGGFRITAESVCRNLNPGDRVNLIIKRMMKI